MSCETYRDTTMAELKSAGLLTWGSRIESSRRPHFIHCWKNYSNSKVYQMVWWMVWWMGNWYEKEKSEWHYIPGEQLKKFCLCIVSKSVTSTPRSLSEDVKCHLAPDTRQFLIDKQLLRVELIRYQQANARISTLSSKNQGTGVMLKIAFRPRRCCILFLVLKFIGHDVINNYTLIS
jgi:hypothetical protein